MKFLYAFGGGGIGGMTGFFVGFITSCGRSEGTWSMTFIFAVIGAIIGFFVGCHADAEEERLNIRTHDADDMKYWGKMNPKYAGSIRCKYCSHFNPRANTCHLYSDFDQSMNSGAGSYYKKTAAHSRCSKFSLTAMDAMAQGSVEKRPDGSYIVGLDEAFR